MTLIRGNTECEWILDNLEAMTQKLSEWEQEFVKSLQAQIAAGNKLSIKQKTVLCKIWDRM